MSEAISYNVVERLSIYCHVYEPVKRFAAVYEENFRELCSVMLSIGNIATYRAII